MTAHIPATLVLEDGRIFRGKAYGEVEIGRAHV